MHSGSGSRFLLENRARFLLEIKFVRTSVVSCDITKIVAEFNICKEIYFLAEILWIVNTKNCARCLNLYYFFHETCAIATNEINMDWWPTQNQMSSQRWKTWACSPVPYQKLWESLNLNVSAMSLNPMFVKTFKWIPDQGRLWHW